MNIKLQQYSILLIIVFLSIFFAPDTVLPSSDSKALKAPANQGELESRCAHEFINNSGPEVTHDFEKTQKFNEDFHSSTHAETFENGRNVVLTERVESSRTTELLLCFHFESCFSWKRISHEKIFEQGGDENV